MSLKMPKPPGAGLFREGYQFASGIEEAVLRNIEAVSQLSETVRTSFGPNGRNKMIINHLNKQFVTSDAATIVRELEVVHPAAKVLVLASQQQESEVGDRTNLVLILAGELLKQAEQLINLGLHPSEIVAGYELARDRALEAVQKLVVQTLPTPISGDGLAQALRPVIASKQYGFEDLLSKLVAEACEMVMPQEQRFFNVDNVRVVKIMGGGLNSSRVVKGMVFGREAEGMVKKAFKANVGVYTCGIDVATTETKGTVLLHNANELLGFSKGEEKHMEKIFQEIADAGVKVIVAGNAVGELAMHFLNRLSIVVIKVPSKFDLRRLCRVVGATPLARLGPPLAEEMGYVDVVENIEIGGDRVTVFRQGDDEVTRTSTIVLRGATQNALDDLERAIDDGVNLVKAIVRDPRLLPGAGATEIQLAKQIQEYGEQTPGLSQHAIRKFGEALEAIPRTLAENAGLDAQEVLSRLYRSEGITRGVDIESESDGTQDVVEAGILDLAIATEWALKYGSEAAMTVLRVDAIIMSKASGIAAPKQNPNWDED